MIYRNAKGQTLFRINGSAPRYKVNETTSMGWYVVDKQYYDEKLKMFVSDETVKMNYYKSQEEYFKKRRKIEKKQRILEKLYKIFR